MLKIETDIVFTNFKTQINDFIEPGDKIIVGREPAGRAVLNVGSMIFCDESGDASRLLWRIAGDNDKWLENHDDCYWQNHLGRLYDSEESVRSVIRRVHPRLINATDQTGDPEWTWQPGDFVCHCGGGAVESRIERCKAAMRKAGV